MFPENAIWNQVFRHRIMCFRECVLWLGARTPKGYGRLDYKSKSYSAHRLSWTLINGETQLDVLHTCDVRHCIRLEHLYTGTNQDNVDDKVNKGRQLVGTRNGQSVLTEQDVKMILQKAETGKYTQTELAHEFGVSQSLISLIVLKKAWRHI